MKQNFDCKFAENDVIAERQNLSLHDMSRSKKQCYRIKCKGRAPKTKFFSHLDLHDVG